MYNIIFYILFVLIIASAFYISFGRNILSSAFSMFILLVTVSGIYVMLNSELFALVNILSFSLTAVLALILFPQMRSIPVTEDAPLPKSHLLSVTVLGVLTALLSSLVSSTRWAVLDINYEFNSLMLIFTKYLPVIILLAVASSVIITSLGVLLSKNKSA